jgi:hypothetical protein
MSLKIRPVSLAEDRQEMLDLMNRNFGTRHEARFAWRHLDNPAGVCWSWLAYENGGSTKRRPVAMVTVFPRHMRVNGQTVLAGQVGSFAVDPTHRSLGPAVQLQRTTFQPVDSGHLHFCYDCPPHDRGMSTFVRLGMQPDCEVYRYALPLRVDDNVAHWLGTGLWTKPIRTAGNLALRLRRTRPGVPGLEIVQFLGTFGDEFDVLDNTAPSAKLIRSSRNARELNWRYRDDPARRNYPATGGYEVFVARRAGELQGFAVFALQSDGIAVLFDVFGRNLSVTGPALLEGVIQRCRNLNASSLHAFCSEESAFRALFLKAGFHRRERNARVVSYAKHDGNRRLPAGMEWAFSQVEVML